MIIVGSYVWRNETVKPPSNQYPAPTLCFDKSFAWSRRGFFVESDCSVGCSCRSDLYRTRLPVAERRYQSQIFWRLVLHRFSVRASQLLLMAIVQWDRRYLFGADATLTMTLKHSESSGCHGRRTLACIALWYVFNESLATFGFLTKLKL